jgi:hypothetical protein
MRYLKLFENYFPDNEPTTEELKKMFFDELVPQSNDITIEDKSKYTFTIIKSDLNIDCEIFYNEETGDYEIEFLGRIFVFNEDTIEGLALFILENY